MARPRPIVQAISLEKFRGTNRSEKPRNFSTLNDLQYTVTQLGRDARRNQARSSDIKTMLLLV